MTNDKDNSCGRLISLCIASVFFLLTFNLHAIAEEVCKNIYNGRKNNVTSKMCVVVDGARIGDLLVKFYRDDVSQKKRIDVTNCTSSFTDVEKWQEVSFKTGGLLIDYRDGKEAEWYILTSGLSPAQRHSWINYSSDSCDFEVEDVGRKPAPESGISGGLECMPPELMGPSGCESVLKATSERYFQNR